MKIGFTAAIADVLLLLLSGTMATEALASTNAKVCLPRWDLSRFGFESPFSDDVDKHLDETRDMSKTFREKYEGKLSSSSLLEAIKEFEQINIRRSLVSSYLSLSYDVALEDDALKKRKGE